MKRLIVVLPVAAMAFAGSSMAQDPGVPDPVPEAVSATQAPSAAPPAPLPPPPPVQAVLPANTELTITPNSAVSSKETKEGETFDFSVVHDVVMNGVIVVPKGTRGQGKVTWRTGKGAFGKSAKMDVAFDWIELAGRQVKVTGTHRQEGDGNTAATLGTVAAFGPFAALVTGKSAIVPNGMVLKAYTAEPIEFAPAAQPRAPLPAADPVMAAPAAVQTPAASPQT